MQSSYFLIIKSLNFEFLRPKWPELAGLGGFAEAYAHSDPVGAISKLRVFCEQVVEWIHFNQRLPKPYQANLIDLLHNQPFKDVVPQVVLSKLHSLRLEGNQAAHGNKGDTPIALRLTREAYNISRWLYVNYANGNVADCPDYTDPSTGGVEGVNQRKDKRAILERISAQEAQMQKLLSDLESERTRAVQAEATADERHADVKFWQMIGRGTRLRPDLFGPELDNIHFQIFDHWGNFERFEQDYKKAEPVRQKSLCERVFEARMNLAATALEKQNTSAFDIATGLLSKQISDLPTGSIPIKEKWPQVQSVLSKNTVREFSAATRATLEQNIAPLMQWVDIAKFEEAYKFDRLIAQLQAELIRDGAKFADLRGEVINLISSLRINLSQVKVKIHVIERVKSKEF